MRFVWGLLATSFLAAQAGAGIYQVFFFNTTLGGGDVHRLIGRTVTFDLYDPETHQLVYHGTSVTEDYSDAEVVSYLEFPDDLFGIYDIKVRPAGYLSGYYARTTNGQDFAGKIQFFLRGCPPENMMQCEAGNCVDTGTSANITDEEDLLQVLLDFGRTPTDPPSVADMNLDGYVDDMEMLYIIWSYGSYGWGPE